MVKKLFLFVCAISLVCSLSMGEEPREKLPSFSMQALGGYEMPLGDSGTFFEPGYSGSVFLRYKPNISGPLMIAGEFEYALSPVDDIRSLTSISGAAGGGINIRLFPFLGLNVLAMGGYSSSTLSSDEGAMAGQ